MSASPRPIGHIKIIDDVNDERKKKIHIGKASEDRNKLKIEVHNGTILPDAPQASDGLNSAPLRLRRYIFQYILLLIDLTGENVLLSVSKQFHFRERQGNGSKTWGIRAF